ncbi:MAG: tetratricopeptide repeat protein, partial [Bacteroidota bacterium]
MRMVIKKNRVFPAIVWCAFLLIGAAARSQTIDSLLSAYKNAADPRQKTNLQLQLAWAYQNQEAYGKAIAYYREALFNRALSDSLIDDEIPALKNMAFCYSELGDLDNEIFVQENILSVIKNGSRSDTEIEKTLQDLSVLYVQGQNYENAIECNQEIIAIAERRSDYTSLAQAYNNLGYIYHLLKKEELSSHYFNKCYNTTKEKNILLSEDDRVSILTNLGIINASLGNFKAARDFFFEAHAIRKLQGDPVKLAQNLNYLAACDYLQNKDQNALSLVSEAIGLLKHATAGDEREITIAGSYKLAAEIMLKQNNLPEFRKYNDLYTRE